MDKEVEEMKLCPWCGATVLKETDTPCPPDYCHHDVIVEKKEGEEDGTL